MRFLLGILFGLVAGIPLAGAGDQAPLPAQQSVLLRPAYDPPFATPYPIPQPIYRKIPPPGQKDELALFNGSPWLVVAGENEVNVVFMTQAPARARVDWGVEGGEVKSARYHHRGIQPCGTLFRIALSGLEPGKTYHYRVVAEPLLEYGPYHTEYGAVVTSTERTFRWPDSDRLRLAMFNDTHNRNDLPASLWALVEKNGAEVDFALLNGDIFSEPLPDGSTYAEVLKAFAAAFADQVPLLYTRGNHEARGAGADLLDHYVPPVRGEYYGGMTFGGTRLVFFDTGEDKPDNHWEYSGLLDFADYFKSQQTWLAGELKGRAFADAPWKVLVCHVPPGDHEYAVPLAMDLLKAPFDFGLCAHMHIVEWRKPGVKTTWQHRDEEPGAGYPILIGGGPGWGKASVAVAEFDPEAIRVRLWMETGDMAIDETVNHPQSRGTP